MVACGGDGDGGNSNPPPPNGSGSCQNNNTPPCATGLTGNNPFFTAIVNSATDVVDYARYAPTQTGEATITLYNFGNNDLDLEIKSSDDQYLDGSFSSTSTQEQVILPVSAGTVYYIVVHAYETGGNPSNYDLSVTLSNSSGPPPSNAMNFSIRDDCSDGQFFRFKFYDVDNNLVWPNSSTHYTTPGFGVPSTHSLACISGARILFRGIA